jgi:hypothetical protein
MNRKPRDFAVHLNFAIRFSAAWWSALQVPNRSKAAWQCPFGGVRVGVLVRIATSGGSSRLACFNFPRVVSPLGESFAGDSFELKS